MRPKILNIGIAALAALLLPAPAAAVSDWKPIVQPEFWWSDMDPGLKANLPQKDWPNIRTSAWSSGIVPSSCFQGFGLSGPSDVIIRPIDPWKFQVLNVTFDDCDTPWVVCRHYDSGISEQDLVRGISRMPVGMREAVGNFVAIPVNWPGVIAWADGTTVVIQDPSSWDSPGLLAHEISHVLDWVFLSPTPYGDFWSYGAEWRAAVDADGVVPTWYAANAGGPVEYNLREDFAEVGRVAIFDVNVPGGAASVHPNVSAIGHQLGLYKSKLGGRIAKGGRCSASKSSTSQPVPITRKKRGEEVVREVVAELVRPAADPSWYR